MKSQDSPVKRQRRKIDQEESKDPKAPLADNKANMVSVDQMQNQISAAMQESVNPEG